VLFLSPDEGAEMSLEQAATLVEVPTKRTVWRIVLTAVGATLLLGALVVGSYAVYHDKTTEISDLTKQRERLRATNATLGGQLATTGIKLRRTSAKLTKATTGLTLAKKNLTLQRKQLVAANKRADENYNAGYSSGSSAGYSSGRDAGIVVASDELACSDDTDVIWLPACN
jgi:hypothetical protein